MTMEKFASSFNYLGQLVTILIALARLTLFIGCGYIIYAALCMLLSRGHIIESLRTDNLRSPMIVVLYYSALGLSIAISLIGIVGSYTRDPKHLSMFALIFVTVALVTAVGTLNRYLDPGRAKEINEFKRFMSEAWPLYDWHNAWANSETTLWNIIQKETECCGLEDSTDWNYWRPSDVERDVLPASCCAATKNGNGKCYSWDAFELGCLAKYGSIKNRSLADNSIYIIINLLIPAVLALIIAKPTNAPGQGENRPGEYRASML